MFDLLPLDPQPYLVGSLRYSASGGRYVRSHGVAVTFNPRPGYSQDEADYCA